MKTDRYIKVENETGWMRDTYTNALINTNTAHIDKAREMKEKRKQQLLNQKRMDEDINNLKSDISEIKDLLKVLAGKNGT
tara:strand:- start:103 stop:342 length:240 start_codon:yes stop_codon:yes gene_type:complete